MLLERIDSLDRVLERHAPELGTDFNAYRNHAYRVAKWPNAGFHKRLVQLTFARLRTNPLSPIPVLKW